MGATPDRRLVSTSEEIHVGELQFKITSEAPTCARVDLYHIEFMVGNVSNGEYVGLERITWSPIRKLRWISKSPVANLEPMLSGIYMNRDLEVDEVVFYPSDLS